MGTRLICLLLTCCAFAAGALIPAATAAATPVHLAFEDGLLDIGGDRGISLFYLAPPEAATATFDGQIESGNLSADAAGAHFPDTYVNEPFPQFYFLSATGPITGNFDPLSGALSLNIPLKVEISNDHVTCDITFDATVSTSTTQPYPGTPLSPAGSIESPGAVAGAWPNYSSIGTSGLCPTYEPRLKGPGGIWLGHGVAIPTPNQPDPPLDPDPDPGPVPARLVPKLAPKLRKVVPRQTAGFMATIHNRGERTSAASKVCISAPKRIAVIGRSCRLFGPLVPGDSTGRSFKVRPTQKASRGLHKITVTVETNHAVVATGTASLRVLRPAKTGPRKR